MTTQPISWKKLTATVAYLLVSVVLTLAQTLVHQTTPQTAGVTIALLVAGALVTITFTLTQGKIDLTKYLQQNANADLFETRLAALLQPVLQALADQGNSLTPAPPSADAAATGNTTEPS